jgi:hypothetical protein
MSGTHPDIDADPAQDPSVRGGAMGSTWAGAVWKSALVLALAALGFLFVPDRLTSFFALRTGPNTRDLLVLLWVAVFFVFLTWLFIRLQRPRSGP